MEFIKVHNTTKQDIVTRLPNGETVRVPAGGEVELRSDLAEWLIAYQNGKHEGTLEAVSEKAPAVEPAAEPVVRKPRKVKEE